MARVVARTVTDREILDVAAAAINQRHDVFERCILQRHRLPADPARHDPMQLTGDSAPDLDAGQGEAAHEA